MFETSWGEIIVMTGLCLALVGRKDLPKASRFVGSQVGRVVGLLQGARVRADRFAAQNELRQLQNELRAGLRDLDAVKAEIAVAASSRGTLGRTLGPTVPSANRNVAAASRASLKDESINSGNNGRVESPTVASSRHVVADPTNDSESGDAVIAIRPLAPRAHAVAAVAQEEWEKQGIGFVARAEQQLGSADSTTSATTASTAPTGPPAGGAKLLANLIQQSLIFDQHDRVVQEQQEALQSKVEDRLQQQQQPRTQKQGQDKTSTRTKQGEEDSKGGDVM